MQPALPEYEIYAIRYATREAQRRDHFIGGDPHDGPMPMDYFVWVAIGPAGAYVIDTGFTAEMAKQRKRTFLRCPIDSLALVGVEPGGVRDVILTHMHYDHVGNFDKFPNARFHLQEREMAYATGKYMRYPRIGHSYHVEDVVGMVRLNFKGRVEMHGGEVEIAPGHRRCIPPTATPTACSRCACIRSAAGWCWRRTRRITTRTWRPTGPSPPRSTSARCSMPIARWNDWRRRRATSFRATIRT